MNSLETHPTANCVRLLLPPVLVLQTMARKNFAMGLTLTFSYLCRAFSFSSATRRERERAKKKDLELWGEKQHYNPMMPIPVLTLVGQANTFVTVQPLPLPGTTLGAEASELKVVLMPQTAQLCACTRSITAASMTDTGTESAPSSEDCFSSWQH